MPEENMDQEQIDELIKKEQKHGRADLLEETFQEYDFNRPDKFLKQNMSSLRSIANVFARGFSQIMSASLRLPIEFKLNEEYPVEQVPYDSEYIRNIGKDRSAFCITELGHPDLGMIIVEIDLSLAIPIHRNMTGAGRNIQLEEERKPMTDIEKLALEEWVEEILYPELESAFRNVAPFKLRLQNVETDPQYVKITRPTDMIALVAFDVEMGVGESKKSKAGVLRLCIPYLSIEKVIDRLTTENASEYKLDQNEESQVEVIKQHLYAIPKKIEVELGKCEISFKDILELAEGDVLELDKKISDTLIGHVAGMPKFGCLPGRKGNHMAVKITSFAKKGEGSNG